MKDDPIALRILQITDTHLLGDVNKNFLGINPYDHLVAVAQNAAQHRLPEVYYSQRGSQGIAQIDSSSLEFPQDARDASKQSLFGINEHCERARNFASSQNAKSIPSLVLLTGDISQDFSPESYKQALSVVSQLDLPIKILPGNHDDINILRENMLRTQDDAIKSLDYDNWHIILLNSHWPKHVTGWLDSQEMDFLQRELSNNHHKDIIIFIHHHILPVGAPWIDRSILVNAKDFLTIISQHQNVKAIFSGHVHQEFIERYGSINIYTTPATSWQFQPNVPTFKLNTEMPGYRIIDLYNNGKYITKVIRLAYNEAFLPDLSSVGY